MILLVSQIFYRAHLVTSRRTPVLCRT